MNGLMRHHQYLFVVRSKICGVRCVRHATVDVWFWESWPETRNSKGSQKKNAHAATGLNQNFDAFNIENIAK